MDTANKYDKLAGDISLAINSFTFNDKDFCRSMTKSHRTLQQSFTRLCLEWIKTCADDQYRCDGRNEMSHGVCKDIIATFENTWGHDIPTPPMV